MADRRQRLEMLETMITKGSEDPLVHYARAMEYRGLGELERSLELFGGVAERFPDYVPTYLMAAQVAEKLERVAEAERWAEEGKTRAEAAGDAHALSELEAFLADL
jgi:hypothetical protein